MNKLKHIKSFESFGDDILNNLDFNTSKDEITEDEMYKYMRQIIKKYYTGEEMRSQIHFGKLSTWKYFLPIAAKKDLDAIGYTYYEIIQVDNVGHKDYGKYYVEIVSGDINKKEDGF